MVYKTEILGASEKCCYIRIAHEHQSTDTVFMPLRVLEYDVEIWQFHKEQYPESKKLPLIINVVYYTGEKPYKNSTDFRDLLDAPKELVDAFWAKPFILIEAQNIEDRKLMQQKWAGLFMYATKHIRARNLLEHAVNLLQLMRTIDDPNGIEYIVAVVNYTLSAGEFSDSEKYLKLLTEGLSEETGEKIMTGAEQLIEIGEKRGIQKGVQQGMQQGMEQGMQQGELQGERIFLKRMLEKRFGEIPINYLKKIEEASADKLLEFGDKLVAAKIIEDIFENYH